MKLTRMSRAGTPQTRASRRLICGKALPVRLTPSTSGAMHSRAFGPCKAIVAHCSVVDVSQNSEIRELGLKIVLHMREHAGRAAGRRRHVKAVGFQARDHAVIHEETGFAQHEAVATPPNFELLEGVGVHAFEKRRRIGANDFDLAERGRVEQADARARRAAFAPDRVVRAIRYSSENTRRVSIDPRPRMRRRFQPPSRGWAFGGWDRTGRRARGRRMRRTSPVYRVGGRW